MNFKKPGRRRNISVLAAKMIRHPMVRQTVEVALLARRNSQRVMAMNATFSASPIS